MPAFRTKDELARAKWAEKYLSVADGNQYLTDEKGSAEESPFPIHEYFKNRLLGRRVKMLELNAGYALVEQMTADTMTDLKVTVEGNDAAVQQAMDWIEETDYYTVLEEAVRNYYGTGYAVQQPFRLDDGAVKASNIDPCTWYPVMPTFLYQDVEEGRIVSVFSEESGASKVWYAFVEIHTVGNVAYELYQLEHENALEGKKLDLSAVPRLAGLKDQPTDLDYLAVFQVNRQKSSGMIFGKSVLAPVWDALQEISEIQTQIRQERIKHFRAKLAAPSQSLQRAENPNGDFVNTKLNSKQVARTQGAAFDINQEIFPIPPGSTVMPQYIQRDLQSIVLGSNEIDKLLSRIASIVGCPRSMFNLDEKGTVHVDTEKRKDRRYIRQIVQGQKKAGTLAKQMLQTWWAWSQAGDPPDFKVKFSSPFDLSQEEVVLLMREMNATADFVSQEEALNHVWPEKTPEERAAILDQIKGEQTAAMPPGNALNPNKPTPVTL